MTWMPFFCLGIGLVFGLRDLSERVLNVIDIIINIALVVLMLTIGLNIGINDSIMSNLYSIGLNCVVIAFGERQRKDKGKTKGQGRGKKTKGQGLVCCREIWYNINEVVVYTKTRAA